jgi:hypothetical protein
MFFKQARDEISIGNRALYELRALRHLIGKAAAQVVQYHNLMPHIEQMPRYVRANKSRSTSH